MTEEKEKFFFIPLRKKSIPKKEDGSYVVSIHRTGQLYLGPMILSWINHPFLRIFVDLDRRTIGFLPVETIQPGMYEARKIIINKQGSATISLANVMRSLGVLGNSFPDLPIKEYLDTTYGKLLYVKIPNIRAKPAPSSEV